MLRLRRTLLSIFLTLALTPALTVAPLPADAQVQAGSISGTVVADQVPLSAATVSISGAASRTVKTGKDGTFTFTGLADGSYQLIVTHTGYAALPSTTVTISGGLPQTLAITLAAASLNSLRTIGSVSTNSARTSSALNTSAVAEATITSQQFTDRGQTQVINELEELPGVEITRVDSGALGSNTNVAVRGVSPYETQVLIDGHPVSGGSQGSYLIQFLNPLILTDIEVDKGPGVFGNTVANAIGGSVNFRTPQITSGPTGNFLTGLDSFNGSILGARFSDTIGKFGFLAGYAIDGTPGYFAGNLLAVNPGGTPTIGGPPVVATIDQAVAATQLYQNRSELFKLGYNFSTTTTLTAGFFGSQSHVDYTGTLASGDPFTIVGSCTTCGNGTFTNPAFANLIGQTVIASGENLDLFQGNSETDNEPIFTLDLRSSLGGGTLLGRYYVGSTTRLLDAPGEPSQIIACTNPACTVTNPGTNLDGEDFQENEIDQLHGGDFEYDLPIGLSSLTLSYDSHNDRSTFCEGQAGFNPATACGTNGLLVTSNTFAVRGSIPLSHKLTLGLANYFSDTTFVGSRYDPDVTLTYRPGRYQSFRFAAGTAYVAPFAGFLDGVAGKSGTLTGEAVTGTAKAATLDVVNGLKPETSQSFDLGGDFTTGRDSKFSVDVYNTILDQRFQTDSVSFTGGTTATFNGTPIIGVSELFNGSDSREQGIEFQFVKAPRFGFGATVGFELDRNYNFNTISDSTLAGIAANVKNPPGSDIGTLAIGAQIPGFAYSKGHGELNYQLRNGARAAFGMTYYGDNNSFGQSAFEIFDANVGIPAGNGFRLQLSGINLFDHDGGRFLALDHEAAYTPIAAPGSTENPGSLFFAPPRQFTLQLSHPL